jgi:hypothetical protein
MECGGKRSATELWIRLRAAVRKKAASRFACRRTPKEQALATVAPWKRKDTFSDVCLADFGLRFL